MILFVNYLLHYLQFPSLSLLSLLSLSLMKRRCRESSQSMAAAAAGDNKRIKFSSSSSSDGGGGANDDDTTTTTTDDWEMFFPEQTNSSDDDSDDDDDADGGGCGGGGDTSSHNMVIAPPHQQQRARRPILHSEQPIKFINSLIEMWECNDDSGVGGGILLLKLLPHEIFVRLLDRLHILPEPDYCSFDRQLRRAFDQIDIIVDYIKSGRNLAWIRSCVEKHLFALHDGYVAVSIETGRGDVLEYFLTLRTHCVLSSSSSDEKEEEENDDKVGAWGSGGKTHRFWRSSSLYPPLSSCSSAAAAKKSSLLFPVKNDYIYCAAKAGRLDMLRTLHKYASREDWANNYSAVYATQGGHLECLEFLCETGGGLVNGEFTALTSIIEGRLDFLNMLFDKGKIGSDDCPSPELFLQVCDSRFIARNIVIRMSVSISNKRRGNSSSCSCYSMMSSAGASADLDRYVDIFEHLVKIKFITESKMLDTEDGDYFDLPAYIIETISPKKSVELLEILHKHGGFNVASKKAHDAAQTSFNKDAMAFLEWIEEGNKL